MEPMLAFALVFSEILKILRKYFNLCFDQQSVGLVVGYRLSHVTVPTLRTVLRVPPKPPHPKPAPTLRGLLTEGPAD